MWIVPLALILLYALRILRVGIANFTFDDALMFVRYAHNMRDGYGVAWNPGGAHVYGLTSLTWLAIVWMGSFIPLEPVTMLVSASWIFGLAALGALSSPPMPGRQGRQIPVPAFIPFVAVPLLLNEHFTVSMTNGMETMLALLLVSLFLSLCRRMFLISGTSGAIKLAFLGMLVVLTRPDALVTVLSFPVAWWLIVERRRTPEVLRSFLLTFTLLLCVNLALAHAYFGTILPLSVYCKWLRGYEGYRLFLNPLAYSAYFFNMAVLPCAVLVLCTKRKDLRFLLAFLLPAFLQIGYLATVNQIMGWGGRYYVPYLPLLFFPATSLVNSAFRQSSREVVRASLQRLAALALVVCVTDLQVLKPVYEAAGRLIVRHRRIYPDPTFVTASRVPLPEVDWWPSCLAIAKIANTLPPGSVVSSSEVGALGALAPGIKIIDSSGLNDETIAKHGFDPNYIFKAEPDLIWLIHPDYTRDFGEMASAQSLLNRYTVYAHALNFGVAIRKDSPSYQLLVSQLKDVWETYYPNDDMAQYETRRIIWERESSQKPRRAVVVQP